MKDAPSWRISTQSDFNGLVDSTQYFQVSVESIGKLIAMHLAICNLYEAVRLSVDYKEKEKAHI